MTLVNTISQVYTYEHWKWGVIALLCFMLVIVTMPKKFATKTFPTREFMYLLMVCVTWMVSIPLILIMWFIVWFRSKS